VSVSRSGGEPVPGEELIYDRGNHLLTSAKGWSVKIEAGGPSWIPAYIGTDLVYFVHQNSDCTGFD
jgi:hypothetical protein